MALVVNNTVKMEWEKSLWLQTKGTKQVPSCFILAAKQYEGTEGTVCVFFRSTCAWVFIDEEGTYEFEDVKEYVKSGLDSSFPEYVEGFHCLYELGEDSCNMKELSDLGLEEFADDIKARVEDLAPYGEEFEVKFND